MHDVDPKPPVMRVCITRYVADLRKSLYFYADLLGLEVAFRFQAPGTPGGAILKLLRNENHLELIEALAGAAVGGPTVNHLVLHFSSKSEVELLARRFAVAGIDPVAPVNSFWRDRAITFADFDNVQLVLSFEG